MTADTTVHYPEGVQSQGNVKVRAALTLSSLTAPSVAQANDSTGIDLSLFLYPGGWGPTVTTNKGTKPPRLASKVQLESFNRSQYGMPDLLYAYDPQGSAASADNKAMAVLTQGLEVFLIERLGDDAETVPLAIGDWVRVHHVRLGEQFFVSDPTDENDEFKVQQPVIYINPPGPRVQLVA